MSVNGNWLQRKGSKRSRFTDRAGSQEVFLGKCRRRSRGGGNRWIYGWAFLADATYGEGEKKREYTHCVMVKAFHYGAADGVQGGAAAAWRVRRRRAARLASRFSPSTAAEKAIAV